MDAKQIEQWLMQEAQKKNSLAEAYLSLLKDATPEMRQHWLTFLSELLGPIILNEKELMNL